MEWAEACFDADGDGLFHSYINTWPTDGVYYNGGATVEETAYIYTAHRALRDLATDPQEAAVHAGRMATIRGALKQLWISERGHPAAQREETGHRRLRPDPWAYSLVPTNSNFAEVASDLTEPDFLLDLKLIFKIDYIEVD